MLPVTTTGSKTLAGHFNPTRVRLKREVCINPVAGTIVELQPTRVRLKRTGLRPLRRASEGIENFNFNPTRVRLKPSGHRRSVSVMPTDFNPTRVRLKPRRGGLDPGTRVEVKATSTPRGYV